MKLMLYENELRSPLISRHNSSRAVGVRSFLPRCLLSTFRQILFVWIAFLWCLSNAQDPIYKVLTVSNVKHQQQQHVWRSYYSQDKHRNRYTTRLYNSFDYSTNFLSFEEVKRDRRARVYNVDFKRRRPNQMSINSRLVWITILAFGLQVWKPAVTSLGWKISDRILRGEQLYRTVTPIFLHGGILHLATNMISLQRVGNDVEKLFGPSRYLATYIVSGICGNLLSAWRSPNPSLGASGAVFGVVGAYFVFLNRNEWLLGEAGQAITNSIGQTMISNIFLGMVIPQIDQWGHLGGAVGGGLMAYLLGPRLYLSEMPIIENGDTFQRPQRIVIDRPIVCAPDYLESFSITIGKGVTYVTTAFNTQIVNKLLPKGAQPWQLNSHIRSQYYIRQGVPNKSIKPGPVD
jgi:membrane associated rhomboid family serine protease